MKPNQVAILAGVVLQIVMSGEATLSAWEPENGCRNEAMACGGTPNGNGISRPRRQSTPWRARQMAVDDFGGTVLWSTAPASK
jgi:hypothetical protein